MTIKTCCRKTLHTIDLSNAIVAATVYCVYRCIYMNVNKYTGRLSSFKLSKHFTT